MAARLLVPLLSPREDRHYDPGRVKLRINGQIAKDTVPIFRKDPINRLFFNAIEPQYISRGERIE